MRDGAQRSRETGGLLLGLVGVIIFAGTLPATRLAVAGLDPWFVTAGRAAVAGILAGATLVALRRPWPAPRHRRALAAAAAMLVFAFPGLIGVSMRIVPVVHASVVLGILPLATAVLGALLLGERPSRRFWALALVGAALVIAFALRDGAGGLDLADALLFLAVLSSALGYVLSADLTRDMPGWEVISWMLVFSLPVTLPLALVLAPGEVSSVPGSAWAGFAYVAVFSQFVGFFAWNAGLAMGGVARVSQVQLLQTFFTLAAAAAVNREPMDPVAVLTSMLVVAVVALGRRARAR